MPVGPLSSSIRGGCPEAAASRAGSNSTSYCVCNTRRGARLHRGAGALERATFSGRGLSRVRAGT
eukprot:10383372-Alexandrium_andersonii.AAC.1